jgi:hypothetical protein
MRVRFLLQGRGALELTLEPGATVGAVRASLSAQLPAPADSLVFVHLGRTLGDDDSLSALKLDVRPYVFVGLEGAGDLAGDAARFDALFRSIPAPKVVKYRARLDANPHALRAVALKVCRGDTALAGALANAPEPFLKHIGVDPSLFRYRSILRDEDEGEPPYPPPPPAGDDHAFDAYPVNVVADGWGAHAPADGQAPLPERAPDAGAAQIVLAPHDLENLRRLAELGLPVEAALRLYLRFDRNLEAAARAGLLVMALSGH